VGAVYTPICGTFLCGQTLCGTWTATEGRSTLVLKPRTFSITTVVGPIISLSVNRPKLLLNARSFAKELSTTKSLGRPRLVLAPRAFTIPPFLTVPLTGKPKLILRARALTLSLSSSPVFRRPKLMLLGRPLLRAGQAGLVPTLPASIILTPSPPATGLLVPTVPEVGLLVPTSEEVR
jgi:hypothetical protein